jgi:hypothetical protein
MPYSGITLTMPDVLWPLFRDNKRLARALPSLAAAVIQAHVMSRYGVRVGIIAVLHTFNGKLDFNSHVHTMVNAGGLYEPAGRWVSHFDYDLGELMKAWRRAIIALLRAALRADQLSKPTHQTEAMLARQETRWWSIHLHSLKSKARFLSYAGRYVRRPPIAQSRITNIGDGTVTIWAKDKRRGRRIEKVYTLEEFIDRWAQHILKRYQHAVRSFGLFAPRSLKTTSAAIFTILGQRKRPRPKPRPWAASLKRDFGNDPLLDAFGKRAKWVRRIAPVTRC